MPDEDIFAMIRDRKIDILPKACRFTKEELKDLYQRIAAFSALAYC
ncbi:MAG: hypothetical protein HQL30_11735 [Candidatus Omnitrophica bacterium]|nr:hypothetical protein [Candidatus Omnitrophota bacterium]